MALRLARDISPDDRHAIWIRVAERIYDEQVRQGWRHRVFRLMRATFANNAELSGQGGFLFNWMAENYVDASLMVIRRELDVQAGTENLRNLLEDIVEHPDVLTRARYRSQWRSSDESLVNRAFDSFQPIMNPGSPEGDYIDPAVVRKDLETASEDAERIRIYAERTRAHRTAEQGIDNPITYRELHQAIADVRRIVGKYYALLTLRSVVQWEPEPQYDTMAALTKPWITDPKAVRAAAKAEREHE